MSDQQPLSQQLLPPVQPVRGLVARRSRQLAAAYSLRHLGAGGAYEETDFFFTPGFILKAMWRWWKLALPAGILLSVCSSAIIWYLFKPAYRAVAWVQINNRTPFLAYEPMEQQEKSEQFVKTQIELLRGPLVLGQVTQRPDVRALPEIREQQDPVKWLRDRIKVESVGDSELYQVSFDGPDPEAASKLINAVVEEYFNRRAQTDTSQAQRVIDLLELEKERRLETVQQLREQMRELGKTLLGRDPFTGNPAGEQSLDIRPLDAMRDRLAAAEIESKVLEAQAKVARETLEAQTKANVSEAIVQFAVEERPEIAQMKAQLAERKALLQQMESRAARGKDDPAYQRLEREIASFERTLNEAITAASPQVRAKMEALTQLEQQDDLLQLETKLAGSRLTENLLRQRYSAMLGETSQSGDKSLELEFTRAELDREEKVFEMIAQRVTELRTEQRAPGRINLLEPAQPPTSPVERLPKRELVLAWFLSLCLPFGLAALWERRVRRVSDIEQLERHSPHEMIAEVARFPRQGLLRRRLIPRFDERRTTMFEESVDNLRTCLLLSDRGPQLNVLAVTSAAQREGKTSIAAQLAVSIARATGQQTLLVDGDMRSPGLHQLFGINLGPGLSQLLAQAATPEDAIVTHWNQYVHVLPAGKLHHSPHKLLGNGAFEELLAKLREMYAFVVIDTPPVLPASEALVLAKAADGAILCTAVDRSREIQVRRASTRLQMAGVRVVGTVLNGVPVREYASRYGNYGYRRSRQ